MSFTQRVVLCSFLVFGARFVQATTINGGPTGIANPGNVLGFDEVTLAQDALVTNQFSAYGVTFSGVQIDTANAQKASGNTGFGGSAYLYSGINEAKPPIVISFDSLVDAAAFAAVDKGSYWTLESFRGGVGGTLVESVSGTITGYPGVGFIGFKGKQFDTLRLIGSDPIAIDTLQFSIVSTIPEPATFLLLGTALVCAGALRRLRH